MLLEIGLGAYALGGVVFARMVAGHAAWKWKSQFVAKPEVWDWLAGWCVGIAASWLWLPALVWRRLPQVRLPAIGAERQAREGEHDAQLEQAKERIAELERETGLS